MRAIYCGLMAAGLTLSIAGGANAAHSGHSSGFQFLPFDHHGHFGRGARRMERSDNDAHGERGERRRHFSDGLAVFAPTIIDVAPAVASDPPAVGGDLVIYAPSYVPDYAVVHARRSVASGPKIIYIGAQPAIRLPVVIYGTRLADAAN
jgi:hypothetical protein